MLEHFPILADREIKPGLLRQLEQVATTAGHFTLDKLSTATSAPVAAQTLLSFVYEQENLCQESFPNVQKQNMLWRCATSSRGPGSLPHRKYLRITAGPDTRKRNSNTKHSLPLLHDTTYEPRQETSPTQVCLHNCLL